MKCPYCVEEGSRMKIHKHLTERHKEEIKQNGEYAYRCPECGETTKIDVTKESQDFFEDISVLSFDMLLDHLEEKHNY